jgi:hypothetical protein
MLLLRDQSYIGTACPPSSAFQSTKNKYLFAEKYDIFSELSNKTKTDPALKFIHRSVDMCAVSLRVSPHHRKRFMAADFLHGGQIDACLNQMCDCPVPEGMPDH